MAVAEDLPSLVLGHPLGGLGTDAHRPPTPQQIRDTGVSFPRLSEALAAHGVIPELGGRPLCL